jgi:hypothetical protein
MKRYPEENSLHCPDGLNRRRFVGGLLAATAAGGWSRALAAATPALAFRAEGREFTFATGALRGTLRGGGRSRGLIPVFDTATGKPLTRSSGLFSPYRLLDDRARYGPAAWDWASEASLRADGAVEVKWTADATHPFDMRAVYRWSAADTLDLTLQVTARQELRKLEVFLASYFDGFPTTVVYAGAPAAFVAAPQAAGTWQMFPRDDEAVKTIQDGRWKHPPSPVDWTIRPRYAAPLAVRRDADRGLAAVLMTRPEGCFAVATPYDGEVHRSGYFSLFGRDLRPGESAATRARLRLGPDLPNEQAVALYHRFLKETSLP